MTLQRIYIYFSFLYKYLLGLNFWHENCLILFDGVDMKITCPMCRAVLEIRKDDVLGKYFVCPNCHWTFQWENHILFAKKP